MDAAAINPLAIVAAVLLPPLGVYLATRVIGPSFWIALALTCLGYVPGVIYALVIVLRPRLRRQV